MWLMLYNNYMDNEQTTIRIWMKTRRKLKILAALLGQSMVEVLHEMVEAKLDEVQKDK